MTDFVFQPLQEEQPHELLCEEDSVLGEEGSRNRVLVELEILVCKTRQMVGKMMKTGGKVLLTALLGIAGTMKSAETSRTSRTRRTGRTQHRCGPAAVTQVRWTWVRGHCWNNLRLQTVFIDYTIWCPLIGSLFDLLMLRLLSQSEREARPQDRSQISRLNRSSAGWTGPEAGGTE